MQSTTTRDTVVHVARAHWPAAALVAVAFVLAVAALAASVRDGEDDRPSGSFCLTFEHPAQQVAQARKLLTRGSLPDDEQGGTRRGAARIVWSERTAAGAPDELEEDAQVVAAGMRRALIDSDRAALDEREFVGALARLEPSWASRVRPSRALTALPSRSLVSS